MAPFFMDLDGRGHEGLVLLEEIFNLKSSSAPFVEPVAVVGGAMSTR
jgi:hypothetical protein